MERNEVSLRIQSECWKIRTKKYSVFGHFSHSTRVQVTFTSDFHTMVVAVLIISFPRSLHKELVYRDYKKFRTDIFKRELQE